MKKSAWGCGVLVAAVCIASTGCMMTGSYHSARILEPGTSNFGLTFGVNQFQVDSTSVFLPNIIPELTFHMGVAKNMEVGGRIALGSMGGELDYKYRFLKTDKLHLAMVPAVGYQGLLVMKGVTFSLPMVATIDLNKRFSITAAGFGRYAHYGSSSGNESFDSALTAIVGDAIMYGASFGPEICGESFFFRPTLEFARVEPAGGGDWSGWNRMSVAVHLGWVFGREKQQLDRIEKKIDKIDEKIDKVDEKL
ncbi:MAG: hypothetical protein JW699_00580 [Chitinispirillaceae bacterium]|nr:hypothetical protein [Chitinispirillaceae bacterium]